MGGNRGAFLAQPTARAQKMVIVPYQRPNAATRSAFNLHAASTKRRNHLPTRLRFADRTAPGTGLRRPLANPRNGGSGRGRGKWTFRWT